MSRTGHDYYKDRDQDMFMGSVRDGTCSEHGQKPELWTGSWKIRRTAGKCSFRDRYRDRMWIMDGIKDGCSTTGKPTHLFRTKCVSLDSV